MFITGPEVVKTVTGEEVSFEELGGATTHATRSGVAHFIGARRAALLRRLPLPALVPAPVERRAAAVGAAVRPAPTAMDPELDRLIPDEPTKPYDMHEVIRRVMDDGEFMEVQERFAENIVCGFARLGGHPIGIVANQPRALAGRARHRELGEGSPVRAHLRRVRPARGHVRGRARLPARHRPGVGRHHPPRREAPLRLLRGVRAQAGRDHPQGLRRRLRRHELQARRRRLQLRLADGRGRGDGPRRRREHRLPQGARGGRRPRRPPGRAGRGVPRAVREPVHRRRARLRRRRHRAVAHAAGADHRARGLPRRKRVDPPHRKHGNIPL